MKRKPPVVSSPWLGKLIFAVLLAFFSSLASAQNLSIVSGNGQLICSLCPAASFAFDPLVVTLKDGRGNPVANATVTWTVSAPSSVAGKVASATTVTGVDGTSSNTFTLSPPLLYLQPFVQATVTATSGGSSVTFNETNSASASGTGVILVGLQLVSPPSGTVFTGAAGSIASVPVQVSVRSFQPGGPVPGVEVRLVSDPTQPATAICSGNPPNSVLTDANGSAVCNVQFGNSVGSGRIRVYVGGEFGTFGPFLLQVSQGVSGGGGQLSATPSSLTFTSSGSTSQTQTVSVTSSSGTVSYTASVLVTLAQVTWLTVGTPAGPAGTTPSTFPVTINPQSLSPGVYQATIDIHPTNGSADLFLPVQLTVQAAGAPGQLTANPAALTFQYPGPLAQTVNIGTSGGAASYTATIPAASPAVNWLTVGAPTGPASGIASSAFQVSIIPGALPAGTSHANIIVHPDNGTPDLTIPVQVTVTAGQLTATPTSLTFQYPGALSQTVSVASTGGSVNYTAAVQVTLAAVTWLTVGQPTGPASSTGQSSFTVSIVPQGLTPGTYRATIAIHADNGSTDVVIPVQLTVGSGGGGGPAQLTATPASLTFQYPGGVTQTVAVGSTGATLNYTASVQANVTWLTVVPQSGTASGSAQSALQVTVTPQGLAPGTYSANITLHVGSGTTDVTIPVQLTVQQTGAVPQLTVNPGSLSFQYPTGALSQTVTVGSTGGAVAYSAVVQPPVGWLTAGLPSGPASASAASSVQVAVSPQSLPPATYQAVVLLQPTNGAPSLAIPVQVIVQPPAVPSVSVFPGSVNVNQMAGGITASAASIDVTSSGNPVPFSATASANWLSVSPASGMTPGQIEISVNATSLAPGNYSGTVNISAPGAANGVLAVIVSLTVQASQNLNLSATSLTFTSQVGSGVPPQTIGVTASSGSLPFTAIVTSTTPAGVYWLTASPSSGTAGASATNVVVSVNPAGLSPGTYSGTISVLAPNAVNSSQTINVTYIVTSELLPLLTRIANLGSNVSGPVSPGEVISISGDNMGPEAAVPAVITGGVAQNIVSDTQVTFDNIPAALMLVSATQINVVVPYAIAGRASTRVAVTYKGNTSAPVTMDVADAAPGIFSDSSGRGNIFNPDGSQNGPGSPAHAEDEIVLFATGEGATIPAGVDGLIIPAGDPTQWKQPVLTVSATIGGLPAQVVYAGSAPGQVSGMLQVNLVVPDGVPIGDSVPVVITVGTTDSPPAAMSIQ